MKNKLGTYISKLMVTAVEKEQDEFIKELALSELRKINSDIEQFVRKHSKNDEEKSEKTIKKLLQEEKENVKNK